MFREPCHPEPQKRRTSGSSSKNSSELAAIPYQSLDLTPGAGNLLDEFYWEILSPWRGESSIRNTGPAPRSGAAGSTLSSILEDNPHPKYYLTRKACAGIIRRSSERDKPLPPILQKALEVQAGISRSDSSDTSDPAKLSNYFGANPEAPHYLTPVFFKKEVLQRYLSHPDRYSVEDGYLRCQSLWGMAIDNHHKDYVSAYLGDLGRDLPEAEQNHWLQ